MKMLIKSRKYSRRSISGFTLVEILVVVTIIAIMATMVVTKFMSTPDKARIVKAKQDIVEIKSALDMYRLDNGFYPTTDQGLQALVTKPTVSPVPNDWKSDGYLESLPIDSWSQPYQYINDDGNVKIFSFGPKGRDGNSEIGNWNMNEVKNQA